MVNLSKKKLDDYVFYRLYDVLFAVFITKRDYREFNKFFTSLFTPTERTMLIKRIGIIYLILKKFSKTEICEFLKISPSTYEKYYQTLDLNNEVFDYFRASEVDSIDNALAVLGDDDYTREEVQLMRIKFLSELGN